MGCRSVRLSFTAPSGVDFPSLASRTIVGSAVFQAAVGNTVTVALLSPGLQLAVRLGVALALGRRFPGRGAVRTVVAGAVMLLVFSRSGYLNALLFDVPDAIGWMSGIEWRVVPLSWLDGPSSASVGFRQPRQRTSCAGHLDCRA